MCLETNYRCVSMHYEKKKMKRLKDCGNTTSQDITRLFS